MARDSEQTPLEKLNQLRERAAEGGSPQAVQKQHAKGKLMARERVDVLFDPGSFSEIGALVTHRSTDFGTEELA